MKKLVEPSIEMSLIETTEAVQEAKVKRVPTPKGGWAAPIYADFTKRYTEESIPFDRIRVDMSYQRKRSDADISKMAHAWDQDIYGRVYVSLRKNHYYYMMDGGGRYEALKMISNRPDMIDAFVFRGMTLEQEAALYRKLDTQRRALSTGSVFKAALVEGDLNAIEINEVANNCGLFIDYDRGPVINNLRSTGTLVEIHRRVGKRGLQRILKATSRAWPNSMWAGTAEILLGLEILFNRYEDIDDNRIIKVLNETTPNIIKARGHAMYSGTGKIHPLIAKVIHHDYNKGLRKNKLPDWD